MNKLTIVILSVLLLSGCSQSANADKDFEAQLDNAYEALNLARLGLDYPPNQEILDNCVKDNDSSCLRAYNRVQEGKKFLLETISRDEDRVLRITLNRIETKCASEKTEDSFICTGAVVSLYFFNKEHHQPQIMDALLNKGENLVKWVFFMRFEWMYNRPDPDEWIAFVKSLPDDVMPPIEKDIEINTFEKSKQPFEKFGVML
ncbi:MAG: hypothetical protein L0Z73_06950 [Gammaproteobacteria bacterium]|nr:hypothetical protein [Gammaproteobacteria bacterium]